MIIAIMAVVGIAVVVIIVGLAFFIKYKKAKTINLPKNNENNKNGSFEKNISRDILFAEKL